MKLIDRVHEPDVAQQQADARLAFECMTNGGVSVLPLSVSYAIFAHTAEGVERIYKLKQRPMTKPNGVIGSIRPVGHSVTKIIISIFGICYSRYIIHEAKLIAAGREMNGVFVKS